MEVPAIKEVIDAVEAEMAGNGSRSPWYVRAGTEPLVQNALRHRIRELVHDYATRIAGVVRKAVGI